jgi:1-acyl-sn-glycerol-3-phosphate acyltransferase
MTKLARWLIRAFMYCIAKVEVQGFENIPVSGSFTAASNHLGRLDVALVYLVLDRTDIILLVAEKYAKVGIFRWLGRHLRVIFIDRFQADVAALRATMARMKQGEVLVVAPEGTRSPTEALQEGKLGVSYLAVKAGVPLIPVAITGSEDRLVKSQLWHFKRAHIIARVGKPFSLPPLPAGNREQALQQDTDEVMCRIAALLPEKYRGVYADHPRLQQLLQQPDL